MDITGTTRRVREISIKRPGLLGVATRWLLLLLVTLVITLVGAALLLRQTMDDLKPLGLYLLISGSASALFGLGALVLLRFAPGSGTRLRLALPPLLAAVVICVNVYLTARLMFIAEEDAGLLLLLLLFGFVLSLGLSSAVAATFLTSIRTLELGARRMALGDYSVRLPETLVAGSDELAQLGKSFNSMAQRVQESFDRQREAEESQRHFIAAISHDLRTPLTSIRAMVEAMDDGVVTDAATITRYLHTIRGETRHLSRLIDDLFELSRLDAGALELHRDPASLDDLLSDTLEAMHAAADQQEITLVGQVDSRLPAVRIDVQRIQRVLYNLIQNAIQHTPAGGAVLIRASALTGKRRGVLVDVMDTGAGIPEDDLPHIFDRFYCGDAARARAATAHNGAHAGLGLTIARALVEAHGGDIRALSPCADWPEEIARPATGPGSMFTLRLPA